MEVHRHLGGGLLEVVYKDALDMNLEKTIFSLHEKKNILLNIKTSYCRISFMPTL